MSSLNDFQKQLDKTRIATIIHDQSCDDDMSGTFKQLEKEIFELRIMIDWYKKIGFIKELKDGPETPDICG